MAQRQAKRAEEVKLPAGDGRYIEAREIVQYDIIRDVYRFRYDSTVGSDKVTTFPQEGGIDARLKGRALTDALASMREQCGKVTAEAISKLGKDLSEATAPSMPEGYTNPTWVS